MHNQCSRDGARVIANGRRDDFRFRYNATDQELTADWTEQKRQPSHGDCLRNPASPPPSSWSFAPSVGSDRCDSPKMVQDFTPPGDSQPQLLSEEVTR